MASLGQSFGVRMENAIVIVLLCISDHALTALDSRTIRASAPSVKTMGFVRLRKHGARKAVFRGRMTGMCVNSCLDRLYAIYLEFMLRVAFADVLTLNARMQSMLNQSA